jgi:hypothetical protein
MNVAIAEESATIRVRVRNTRPTFWRESRLHAARIILLSHHRLHRCCMMPGNRESPMRDLNKCRALIGCLAVVAAFGCHRGADSQDGTRTVSSEEAVRMLSIAEAFWTSVAHEDSVGMTVSTSGDAPLLWARRQIEAYPSFFDSTRARLSKGQAYYLREEGDSAILEVEVPWVTCRPPVHAGNRDHYSLMLTLSEDEWRIARVWIDPC